MIAYIFMCFILYVTYKYVQYYKSPLRLLPSPPSHSILGHVGDLRSKGDANDAYLEWSLKYGGIFAIKLFSEDVVIISDPELARQVFLNPQIFTKKNWRYDLVAALFGDGLITQSDVDIHRKRRGVIGEAFSYSNLKLYFPIFTIKGKTTLSNLRQSVGQTVDIYKTFNDCAFDVIGKAAFGCDFDTQISNKEGKPTEGQIIAEKARQSLNTPFGILDSTIFRTIVPKNRKAYQLSHSLNQHIQDIIQHKRESIEKNTHTNFENDENQKVAQKDLLDILIQLKHEDGSALTNSELVDEVKTFLFAGTETSATSITFTLWYIARHPEVEEKLVDEIQTVLGSNSLPTVETLDKMTYLNNVFKESLRIMPPVTQTSRITDTDVKLGDYLIPKGTVIYTSIYALHHSPSLWENPEQFNPDRWETDVDQEFGSFVPFLLGARNCIGQRFAGLEVKAILSMILREFTFSIPPNHPEVKRTATLVVKPQPYIKLIPHLRK